MIFHQILVTSLQGNVEQLEERINDLILGFKGLSLENIPVQKRKT